MKTFECLRPWGSGRSLDLCVCVCVRARAGLGFKDCFCEGLLCFENRQFHFSGLDDSANKRNASAFIRQSARHIADIFVFVFEERTSLHPPPPPPTALRVVTSRRDSIGAESRRSASRMIWLDGSGSPMSRYSAPCGCASLGLAGAGSWPHAHLRIVFHARKTRMMALHDSLRRSELRVSTPRETDKLSHQ